MGLLNIQVKGKETIGKIFTNSLIKSAFSGKIDLQKEFNLSFGCILELNSDQNFSVSMKNGCITLKFNKTYPKLYAEKIFSIESEIDAVYIYSDKAIISLTGLPDLTVNFI